MRPKLLNSYSPKLIATILKALREQLKENYQLNAVEEIAGPAPETHLEYDQILKEGRRFCDDVNGGYLPEDLVLTSRREELEWVHSEGVYENAPVQECDDAGKKLLELIWVAQVCGPRSQEHSIETVCQTIQDEEARQDSKRLLCFSDVLGNATT